MGIKAGEKGVLMSVDISRHHIGAMELLGIIGFSLLLGWLFPCFLWFPTVRPEHVTALMGSIALFAGLVGLVGGYTLIRLAASKISVKVFFRPLLIGCSFVALLLPVIVELGYLGLFIPYSLFVTLSCLAGVSTAYFIVSWLDICGKTRIHDFLAFTSASFAAGGVLFFVCYFLPAASQPIICVVFLASSIALLFFINSRKETNEVVIAKHRSEFLTAPFEMEPLFFIFGTIFGIFFVLMLEKESFGIIVGMAAVLLGSLCVVGIALANLNVSMVMVLRAVVVMLVAACLATPFTEGVVQTLFIGMGVGLWAVFTIANFASLIKLVTSKKLPVFYHVSVGLIPKSVGFLIGWFLAVFLVVENVYPNAIALLMLAMVFVLVFVSMVFYPEKRRHDESDLKSDFRIPIALGDNEELLDQKCAAIAKLFALTPREEDTLRYLARGRNAQYICNKLVVSPHTVKSHIYSIYRKTDSHSQQKLMDLVEEYPIAQATGAPAQHTAQQDGTGGRPGRDRGTA